MLPLCGKVALITGASSGIGRHTAFRLSQLGARVVLVARRKDALQEVAEEVHRQGGDAFVWPTDVTDAEQCRVAVAQAVARYGQLDVVVCSAGVAMRARFEETCLDAIDRVMQVNFFGTLYVTRHALPHVKATRGSLVAVSSLVGKRGTPTYAVYGASKFAVQGLYESLRVELAADGVHVGIVSPGHVETPLRERTLGPDGQVWATSPTPPFRVWPVEKVVDRLVRLIEKRQAEAVLPGFVGPMLGIEKFVGSWLGDRLLARQFRKHPLPDTLP